MEDVHGITDTQRSRYTQTWKAWRKQVKKYERIASMLTYMFGMPRVRISLPGTWEVDYEHALLDAVVPWKETTPKASAGQRVSAVGALILMREEDDAELVRVADLMREPVPLPREVESPHDWYHSKHGLAWSKNNFAIIGLHGDGTPEVGLFYEGLEVTQRQANMDKTERFAKQHGWRIEGIQYRGHGEGFKDQHRARAIEEALALVSEGRVPVPRRKRGRPRVTWVVLSELGRRGVSACRYWADVCAEDELVAYMLDHDYAHAMKELIPAMES